MVTRQIAWGGVLALALACLLFLLAEPAYGWKRYGPLDSTASWLANGRKVHVRCLTPEESATDWVILSGASAYVEGQEKPWNEQGRWRPKRFTVFAHGICEALVGLRRANASDYTVEDVAWAVLVLVHESGHLRGHRWSDSEALTQRWALRHYVYAAMRLGVPEDAARLLLRYAVTAHRGLPPQYLARGCRKPWVDQSGRLRNCRAPNPPAVRRDGGPFGVL